MKGLLNECLPQAQYSAISSTVTLSDDIFKNIKQFIITKNVGEYTANKKVSIETFFNIKFFNTKLNYESYSSMSA